MKYGTMLLALFAASCFLAQSVLAQYPLWSWYDPQALAEFLFPGMNPEWLRIPDVLYYVILPFIAAFTVIYGLLRELRIFRANVPNKVNIVLAFCMAFMLLPSGVLTYIVTIFYAGSAFVGMMAFGIVFLVGIILWAYGTTGLFWHRYSLDASGHGIKEFNKRYAELQKRLSAIDEEVAKNPQNTAKLIGEKEKIYNELGDIAVKRKALMKSLEI